MCSSAPSPESRTESVYRPFHVHWVALVRLARLLVDDRETAEDVVQDAFAQLHPRRWGSLRDPDAALFYLRASVANGARNRLRSRRVARLRVVAEPVAGPSAETTVLEREEQRSVVVALATLPWRQRQVLVLRYYAELSESDIAATLGISKGAVKSHASRGVAALTRRLEEGP